MVTVALAGANTGLGLTIAKSILATKKHNVIIFTRTENNALVELGAEVRTVDYRSHSSLVTALKDVHTLISCIGGIGGSFTESQLALIAAAREAGVKRFAPSEFAIPKYEGIDLYEMKVPVWEATLKAREETGMEITRFSCGLFMNVFGVGSPKGEEEALGGLRRWSFIVNCSAGTADFPGDGTNILTFTDTWDVGAFVAAALDIPDGNWPLESEMAGENMSFKHAVKILEEVQKRKFLKKENSMAELERMAEDPAKRFYNQCRILIANGDLAVKPTLNELCPQVKPKTVRQFIETWWGGVAMPEPKWEDEKIFGADNL